MEKIKKVSLFFRVLFQITFIFIPLLLILFWINAPQPVGLPQFGFGVSFIPEQAGSFQILHVLSPMTKLMGLLICFIPIGVYEFILYFLIRLFRLYSRGEIFSLLSVSYIKKVGYTLLIGQALEPLYQALQTANLSWGNGHGHRVIAISVSGTNIGIILFALLTILIAWIMTEACKLREEQQLTV